MKCLLFSTILSYFNSLEFLELREMKTENFACLFLSKYTNSTTCEIRYFQFSRLPHHHITCSPLTVYDHALASPYKIVSLPEMMP